MEETRFVSAETRYDLRQQLVCPRPQGLMGVGVFGGLTESVCDVRACDRSVTPAASTAAFLPASEERADSDAPGHKDSPAADAPEPPESLRLGLLLAPSKLLKHEGRKNRTRVCPPPSSGG